MKQKKINKRWIKSPLTIILLLITCIIVVSCEKYVDIKSTSSINLIQSANDCQLLLNNYNNMNVGYPSDGEQSADDYYLNDASYLSTSLTATDRDLYTWNAGAIRDLALPQWQTPYRTVYFSNLVIENIEKLKGSTDQVILDDIRGQALFFRAFNFWQIAQIYANTYITNTANSDLGIPLRLSSDINGKSERGTIQQTYNQIINDLKQASEFLSPTSSVASRPNKGSAYAMLSRVYLSMGDYTQALNNATLALQLNSNLLDYNTISTSSSTPFTRFNKEVIFHALTNSTPILNPNSGTDNIAKIDLALVSSYASNDLRRQIYLKANSGINLGSYRFTGNYEPATSSTFFDGLAVDEIYLIRAECYARNNQVSAALTDLNTLLRTRWLSGTYVDISAINSEDALIKILAERRKELLMRGLRWTDLRRLNKESRFAKTISRSVNGEIFNLPPNDLRYTLLIPNEVIVKSGIQQNPR